MKRFAVSFWGVLMIVMAVSGCTGKKPAEQYVSEQLNCSLPAAEKAEVSLAIYDLDENILYYCEIDT